MSASHEFIITDALAVVVRLSGLAGVILLGPTATALMLASQQQIAWKHWYLRAVVAGCLIGFPVGAFVALATQAAAGGFPEPWSIRFIPLGGVVGAAAVAAIFSITVALVHAVSRLGAGRPGKTTADAADDTI
jgi:hypothetical protein